MGTFSTRQLSCSYTKRKYPEIDCVPEFKKNRIFKFLYKHIHDHFYQHICIESYFCRPLYLNIYIYINIHKCSVCRNFCLICICFLFLYHFFVGNVFLTLGLNTLQLPKAKNIPTSYGTVYMLVVINYILF